MRLEKYIEGLFGLAFFVHFTILVYNYLTTVRTVTSSRKVPIENLEFPAILDVCHTPAFNESILEEFGYSGIYDFFAGYSKYDKNIGENYDINICCACGGIHLLEK